MYFFILQNYYPTKKTTTKEKTNTNIKSRIKINQSPYNNLINQRRGYMQRNLEWAKENKDLNFIGFWGVYDQNKEFSNFYNSPFVYMDGDKELVFENNEKFFMYMKAIHFKDEQAAKEILALNSTNGQDYKRIGRKVKNFNEQEWESVRCSLMIKGLILKFSQSDYLKEKLLNTQNAILVETSKYDRIWGIGLDKGNPNWKNPDKWLGKNLLGFCLMEVRNILRNNPEY